MEPSFEQLLHEAQRDGNTAAAAALARAIEERTRLASQHYSVLTQGIAAPQQQPYIQAAIPVQAQTVGRVLPKKNKNDFNWISFVCSWKMTAIVAYIAVAEVMNTGHQGLLKLHQLHWFWGPRAIVGMIGVKLPDINLPEVGAASEEPEVVGEVEVSASKPEETPIQEASGNSIVAPRQVMVQCGTDTAKFSITDVNFTLHNIESCNRGILNAGQAIATVTTETYATTNDGQVIQNFTLDDLREADLLK